MRKQEQKGTITVFLAVNFLVIIALLGTLIDGARVAAANAQLYRASTIATNSILAQYSTKLKDKYGLYAYMGNEEDIARYILSQNIDLITKEGESLFENMVSDGLEYITGKPENLFNTVQMQLTNAELGEAITLLDQDEFKRQILEYSKFRVPLDWVDNRQDLLGDFKEAIDKAEEQITLDKKVKQLSLQAIEVQEQEVALNNTTAVEIPQVQEHIKNAWKDLRAFVSDKSATDYNRQYLEKLLGKTDPSHHNQQKDTNTPIFLLKKEFSQMGTVSSQAANKIDKLQTSKETLKDSREKELGKIDQEDSILEIYETDLEIIERTTNEHTSTSESLEKTSKQYAQLSETAKKYNDKIEAYISQAESCLERINAAEDMPEETEEQQLKKQAAIEKGEAEIAKFAAEFKRFVDDNTYQVIIDKKPQVELTDITQEGLTPEEQKIKEMIDGWMGVEEKPSKEKHTKDIKDKNIPHEIVEKQNIFKSMLDKFTLNKPKSNYAIESTDTKEYQEAERLTQYYKNGDTSSGTTSDSEEGISDNEVNPFWNIFEGIKSNMVEASLDMMDKPILAGYAIKSFSNHLCRLPNDSNADVDIASYKLNFRGKEKQGFFDDCEIEYLIKGQGKEQKNLDYVEGEVTAWCGLFNYISARRVSEINRAVEAMASTVRAAMLLTPAAPLAPTMYYIVKESAYITIAYIQAELDTEHLLNGNKVPLLKSELGDFDVITGTFKRVGSSSETAEKRIGKLPISYIDFLYIKLSFVQEEKLLQRMQNLVQVNMREDKVGGTPDFELEKAKTSVLLHSEANLPYWFINVLFFGKDSDGAKMTIKKTASEHY